MIIHPAPQGSLEWLGARLGLPTASQLHRVVTPAKLQLSEKRHEYMAELLSEWLTGEAAKSFTNFAMEWGTEQEPYARQWYAEKSTHWGHVAEVGLCLRDDGKVGASVDGFVGDNGQLEVKCPLAPQHIRYLAGFDKIGSELHMIQIQSGLWITGREWCDCVVFHPRLPKLVQRVYPEEKVFKALAEHVNTFISELEQAKLLLQERGCVPYGQATSAAEVWR